MDIITTIEYGMAAMVGFYLLGLTTVWIYELKRNALYRQMKQQVRLLEDSRMCMALLHAKTYKIQEDYHRKASGLEMVQQFILKNVLLIRNMQESLSPSLLSSRRVSRR